MWILQKFQGILSWLITISIVLVIKDILLGAELFYVFLSVEQINLGSEKSILQKTVIGCISCHIGVNTYAEKSYINFH